MAKGFSVRRQTGFTMLEIMISLLLINYRASSLAINAIRSAREATKEKLEVVVVDNSCDPAETDALKAHASTLIASERNLGYAGGINRGRPACHGDVIVVANPDVVFEQPPIEAERRSPLERR